jgi:hypothetical protein
MARRLDDRPQAPQQTCQVGQARVKAFLTPARPVITKTVSGELIARRAPAEAYLKLQWRCGVERCDIGCERRDVFRTHCDPIFQQPVNGAAIGRLVASAAHRRSTDQAILDAAHEPVPDGAIGVQDLVA